jgi:hypothetical protein
MKRERERREKSWKLELVEGRGSDGRRGKGGWKGRGSDEEEGKKRRRKGKRSKKEEGRRRRKKGKRKGKERAKWTRGKGGRKGGKIRKRGVCLWVGVDPGKNEF